MKGVHWFERGSRKDITEEMYEQVLKDEQSLPGRRNCGKSILGRGNSICKGKEGELRFEESKSEVA